MASTNMCEYILTVNRILNEKFDAVENESVLENLIETASKYPVAIISSCGSTKSGNSTLLNFIYKALKRKSDPATAGDPIDWNNYAGPLTGFPWSSGTSRTTKGIWITKEPVLISHNHQTVAVYLMDIEGIFDMEFLSNEESEIILGFAILLSTNLLFTMQHGISESRLSHLAKVLHKLKTDFPDLGTTNIHLVVKDWFSAKAVDLEAGDTYLLQKMTTSEQHSTQYKFTRQVLNESFGPKLSCTMFPRLVDGDCDSNFIGSLEQLNGNYLTVLEKFLLSNRVFNFNRLFHNGNKLKIHLDSFRKFFLGLNRTPNDTKELIRGYVDEYKSKMKIRFERENHSEIPSLQAVEEYHHLNVEKIEKKLKGEISLNKLTKDECLQVLGEINDEYKLGKDQLTQTLDEHELELKTIAQKHLEEYQREQLDLLKINHDKVFEQQRNGSIMSAIDKFKDKAVQGTHNPEIVGRLTLWLKLELDEHTRKLAEQRRSCLHSAVENIEMSKSYSILHQPTTSYVPVPNPENPIPIHNIEEVTRKPAVVTPKPRARAGISSSTVSQSPQSLSSPQTSDTTKKELMLAFEEKLRNWDNVNDPLNFDNEFKEASDKILHELNEPEYAKEFRLIFDQVVQEKGDEIKGKLNKEAQLLDEIELSHTVILRLGIQEKSRSSDSGVILGVDKLIRTAIEEFRRKSPFKNCASYIRKTSAQFEKKLHNVLTQIAQEENKNMILSELENANLVHEVSYWYCIQMDKSFAREDYIEPQTLSEIHRNNIKTAKEKFGQNIPTKNKTIELTLDKLFVEYKEKNQMNKPGNVAIGIDLGTTYCCVGIYRKGKVEIISDRYGSTIPSYVALLGSGELIGHEAKEKAHISPEETIFDAKRLIGRKFDDPQVQNDIKLWPFKVTSNDNVPQVEVNGNTYEPEKISAKLLYYIKELAKTHLKGQEVVDAVITVPAAFGDGQRQATKDASFIAGLNVLRIINEPTAAALAYNLQRFAAKNGGKKNILVYDLGGGTFDVSILAVQNGELVVKATDGDTHLGGEDFDEALVNHCLNEFQRTNRFSLTSTTGPNALSKSQISKLLRRIRNVCEGAKRTLSDLPKVQIDIAQIAQGKDLQLSITRQEFESMNRKRFQDTMKTVENTLREAKLTKDQIDDVVLVGGSTKIPKIRQLLETYFGKKPVSNINADEAVAYGAAIQAAILNGEIPDVILQDVCSSSLGIELHDGSMSVVIKRNEPLPVSQERSHYVPSRRGQSSVTIIVYQGEHRIANQNDMLGKFELKNLPTKYIPNITVRMEMNLEGIIHVTASCEGEKANIQINLREGKGRMSERRIESAKKEIQGSTKTTG